MNLKILLWYFGLAPVLNASELVITEVYPHASKSPWFEVYNPGPDPIDLGGAEIRRLDGLAKEVALKITLAEKIPLLEAFQYALIAQKSDLGLELCFDDKTVVIQETSLQFKASGVQFLCIKTTNGIEDCAQFSNSTPILKNHSKYPSVPMTYANDDVHNWQLENCEISPSTFASPANPGGFCHGTPSTPTHIIPCESLPDVPKAMTLEKKGNAPKIQALTSVLVDNSHFQVTYQATDEDPEDWLRLELFYTQAPDSSAGTSVATFFFKSQEAAQTWTWDTSALAKGDFYVFGVLQDAYGNESSLLVSTPCHRP